jgi:hypothetical protein
VKLILVTLIVILSALPVSAAPPKGLSGLWMADHNNTRCSLRLSACPDDSGAFVNDLTGTLSTHSIGLPLPGMPEPRPTNVPVAGQYYPGPDGLTVVLNIGAPGSQRQYAIGLRSTEYYAPLVLRLFRVRQALGINYDGTARFYFKGALPTLTDRITEASRP